MSFCASSSRCGDAAGVRDAHDGARRSSIRDRTAEDLALKILSPASELASAAQRAGMIVAGADRDRVVDPGDLARFAEDENFALALAETAEVVRSPAGDAARGPPTAREVVVAGIDLDDSIDACTVEADPIRGTLRPQPRGGQRARFGR